MIAPCKDCPDRIVTKEDGKVCERSCQKYKEFRVQYRLEMQQINEKKQVERMISNSIWRNI